MGCCFSKDGQSDNQDISNRQSGSIRYASSTNSGVGTGTASESRVSHKDILVTVPTGDDNQNDITPVSETGSIRNNRPSSIKKQTRKRNHDDDQNDIRPVSRSDSKRKSDKKSKQTKKSEQTTKADEPDLQTLFTETSRREFARQSIRSKSAAGGSLRFPDLKSIELLTHTPVDPATYVKMEDTFWKEKKSLIPDYTVMENIDKHVLKAPNSLKKSPDKLVEYLIKPCRNDIEKARALIRWIGENIQYDTNFLNTGERGDQSVEAVLVSGKAVCDGYGNVCLHLATLAGLECMKISGQAKGASYHPGNLDPDKLSDGAGPHAWNALKINGQYYLSDATWAAGASDKQSGKSVFNKRWREVWFITNPEDFVLTHIPLDGDDIVTDKQLLHNPITDAKTWTNDPVLCPHASLYGLEPLTHNTNVIETTSNEIVMQFKCEFPVNVFHDLTRRERRGNTITVVSGIDKWAAVFAGKDILTAIIRFEKQGDYEFELWCNIKNGHSALDVSLKLVNYKITCHSNITPLMFPIGLNNDWGFSQRFIDANYKILYPDHATIKTKDGEAYIQIQLPTKGVLPNMFSLIHSDGKGTTVPYDDYVIADRDGSRATYRIQCPVEGEYRFEILAKYDQDTGFYPGAAFLIRCDSAIKQSHKLDLSKHILGPSKQFYDMGFVTSAKKTTLNVRDGEARLRVKKSKPASFTAKLTSPDVSDDDCKKILTKSEEDDLITCTITPTKKGLYVLKMFADVANAKSLQFAGSYVVLYEG